MAALALGLGLSSCGREAPSFAPGQITVTSSPAGAAILIDGRDTGEITPHTFPDLEADLYDFSVELAEFAATPGHIPVELTPLDDVTLQFALSRTALHITSEPAGATIFIDGGDSGRVTPATIADLVAGPVTVSLALDTYRVSPASFEVEVVADSVLVLPETTFTLRPQRTVLIEGFGNTNCGPCPQLTANLVATAAKPQFPASRMLYLEFSVNWPNPVDPLYQYNSGENSDRFTSYVVLGAPALYVDGAKLGDALDVQEMEDAVLAHLQTDPGFRVDVTADFTNPTIPVAVTLVPAQTLDLAGYSLFVALYEKEIDFAARGLPVGTNGQVIFHHVFRDRADTPVALGALAAGTPQVHTVSLVRGDWALENLAVVAAVQRDADLAIIQVGSYGAETVTGGNP